MIEQMITCAVYVVQHRDHHLHAFSSSASQDHAELLHEISTTNQSCLSFIYIATDKYSMGETFTRRTRAEALTVPKDPR